LVLESPLRASGSRSVFDGSGGAGESHGRQVCGGVPVGRPMPRPADMRGEGTDCVRVIDASRLRRSTFLQFARSRLFRGARSGTTRTRRIRSPA